MTPTKDIRPVGFMPSLFIKQLPRNKRPQYLASIVLKTTLLNASPRDNNNV
jgi:hypothetical protein